MVLPNLGILSLSLTYLLLVCAQENSKFEQFLEDGDGELRNFAWEALKILGGENDNGKSNATSSVTSIATTNSQISFSAKTSEEFGKEVDSSSSSRQHKSVDLRNLKKQIRELDEQSMNSKFDHIANSANTIYSSSFIFISICISLCTYVRFK